MFLSLSVRCWLTRSPMTRFQLILPVQSQNFTKNRTFHRMHVEGIQICQINGWNNSFQNMCSINRQKLSVWPGKSILCKKKHLKNSYFCVHESELPDFGRTWTLNCWQQVTFWQSHKKRKLSRQQDFCRKNFLGKAHKSRQFSNLRWMYFTKLGWSGIF